MLFVYLARHGETSWNAEGKIQGHTDIPLNEAGRDQANALADQLASKNLAAVGTSDLSRARETAAIVAKALGLKPPVEEPLLRERQLGVFEGLTRAQLIERWPREWEAYKRDHANTPPEGEPYAAFLERILTGARRLTRKLARPDRPALIVAHGGVLKALIVATLDAPALVTVPNGALYRFSLEGERLLRAPSGA
ncbi:MAG: histidine phosphatase family protein [Planctomycetota bacterium]